MPGIHINKFISAFLAICLLYGGTTNNLYSQSAFSLLVEPYQITNLPGLQSFAAGQYDGKWLIMGGRLDGLHLRQPNQSFAAAGNNTNIYVVNPETKQVWSASVNNLPVALREQLQSANMQFAGKGSRLYLTGGYGYSASVGNHKTHAALVVINMPGLMQAIINGQPIESYFRFVADDYFAVTGGQLGILGDTLLLVGGHRFDGRYNPNNMPSFSQSYTQQIRKFMIADDGINLSVSYKEAITDAAELHRRDYNMAPQVFPDGQLGYTAFSGVFQVNANLPFLNSVDITSAQYTPKAGFNQLLNHYHSGKLAVYDSTANQMHTVFFGGMAQYYVDAGGNIVQDNEVPFVSTIGRVVRNSAGEMTEEKLGDLPGLLGSGAEFLVNHAAPHYDNEVINLSRINEDTLLAGYLYGGIESSARNIFFINDGTQSAAVNRLYKVLLIKKQEVLPLKFLSFRGQNTLQGNLLQWQVSGQDLPLHFVPEFSADGRKFLSLAALPGTSRFNDIYTFIHNLPDDGLNYYRIKVEKKDGSFFYSSTITIRNGNTSKILLVFPNPVRDMLTIELPYTNFRQAIIRVMDLKGQVLTMKEFSNGSKQLFLNTSALAKGVYTVQVSLDGALLSNQFIRE
jgi:hypothetical protein